MDRFISDLMGRMTLQEKLGQLNLPAGNDLVSGAVKNSKIWQKLSGLVRSAAFSM